LSSEFAAPDLSAAHLPQNLDDRLAAIEKQFILEALAKEGGVQVRAAALLGIKERSLWHRIAKHRIDVAGVRSEHGNGNGANGHPQEMKHEHHVLESKPAKCGPPDQVLSASGVRPRNFRLARNLHGGKAMEEFK
jgi:hypothetical protein